MDITLAKKKSFLKRINVPTRSSALFTVSGIITKGAALLFTPIFTRLLSSSEYGTYSLFNSYLSVLIVLGTLEIGSGASLRAFQRYRGREYTVILTAFLLTLPSGVIALLTLALLRSVTGGEGLFAGAFPLLLITVLSSGIINLVTARAKFLYKPAIAILLSLISGVLAPVISIFLISLGAARSYSRAAIKVASSSFVLLLCAVSLLLRTVFMAKKELRSLAPKERYYLMKECGRLLFRLSLPLLPYYFSVMAISQADKLAVSRYLGASALGGYSVAYSTGLAPLCVTQGLICALTPWVMRKVRGKDYAKVRATVNSVFSILCALISLFLVAAPEIFSFLAPEEYRSALPVTFIIALAPLPLFLMNIESSVMCAYERTLPTVLTGGAVSVVSVAASYLWTPRLGFTSSAICVLASYVTVATVQAINIRRLPCRSIFGTAKCVGAFLLTAIFSFTILALRGTPSVRIALAVLPLASLVYMLKNAKELLRDK